MDEQLITSALEPGHGVASRTDLVAALGRSRVDDLVRRKHLVAVFPRAYSRPWDVDVPDVRLRAALTSVGGEAGLSHVTALRESGLYAPNDGPIHVTAFNPRHPRGVPGELVVHRTLLPLQTRELNGLPVVRPETAVATSWAVLGPDERRAPVIDAARRRLLSPAKLREVVERMWWLPDARELRELVSLLMAGCESELELWGYTNVFDVPGLDDGRRQLPVQVGDASYRIDLAFEEERLAVELDGRAYHASPQQWERDIARDLALATIGWQTIRLSHFRLRNDIDGCRRDVLAVRASRRRLLSRGLAS